MNNYVAYKRLNKTVFIIRRKGRIIAYSAKRYRDERCYFIWKWKSRNTGIA